MVRFDGEIVIAAGRIALRQIIVSGAGEVRMGIKGSDIQRNRIQSRQRDLISGKGRILRHRIDNRLRLAKCVQCAGKIPLQHLRLRNDTALGRTGNLPQRLPTHQKERAVMPVVHLGDEDRT